MLNMRICKGNRQIFLFDWLNFYTQIYTWLKYSSDFNTFALFDWDWFNFWVIFHDLSITITNYVICLGAILGSWQVRYGKYINGFCTESLEYHIYNSILCLYYCTLCCWIFFRDNNLVTITDSSGSSKSQIIRFSLCHRLQL